MCVFITVNSFVIGPAVIKTLSQLRGKTLDRIDCYNTGPSIQTRPLLPLRFRSHEFTPHRQVHVMYTPSRPSAICGRRTPESVLRAVAAARPTARRFQSIPRPACCVRMWRLIAQPLGRDWVCVWRGAGGRGDGGGAGWRALRGRGKLRLMRCVTRTFRNDAHLTTFLTGRGLSGMVRVSDVPHRICRRFTPS